MLPHLASRLFGTPLLVHRAKLDIILAVLGERLDIQPPTVELALQPSRPAQLGMPGIAVNHKNDFSPHQPLTDAAKGELQAEVDRLYGMFVEHVATMRSLDAVAVQATEAGLFFGGNAIPAGLADAVGTLDTTLIEFSQYLSTRRRQSPQARVSTRTEAASIHKEDTMSELETAATPVAEMIDVDAAAVLVAEQAEKTRREVNQNAQAIAELCLIANVPDKAAEFIAAGRTEAEVRRALIETRAARTDAAPITSTIHADAGTQAVMRPEDSPVVGAIKKLIAKE